MEGVAGQRLFQGFIVWRHGRDNDTHISNVLLAAFTLQEAVQRAYAGVQEQSAGATVSFHRIDQIEDQMILDAYEHLAFTPEGKRQVRFGLGGK